MKDDSRNVPPPRVWEAEKYNRSEFALWMDERKERWKGSMRKMGVAALFIPMFFYRAYLNVPEPGCSLIRALFVLVACAWVFAFTMHWVAGLEEGNQWYEVMAFITGLVLSLTISAISLFGWMKK